MLKRWLEKRVVVLIVGGLAIFALAALSIGLASFEFEAPGQSIFNFYLPSGAAQTGGLAQDLGWLQNLMMFFVALGFTAFIIALINPQLRKWLLKRVPYLIAVVILMLLLSRMKQFDFQQPTAPTPQAGLAGTPGAFDASYVPPQISLVGAFVVVLSVLLFVTGFAYYWWLRRPARKNFHTGSLQELGEIVQSTLNDLDAGRDWENTIIKCYVRMSETVSVERGLQRQQAMTPAEFAARLVRAGLPASAVQRLTQLFEATRYGAQPSTRADVDEAVACLRVIVDACGGAA